MVMRGARLLCTSAGLNLGDRVWGEVEKNSFIALPGKGGHSKLMPTKPVCPTQEDLVRRFMATVQGGTDDKIRVLCRVRIPLIWPQVVFSGMKNADIFHLLKRAQRYCYVNPLRQKQDPAPPGCTIVS